eukprot:gene10131-11213_t
MSNQMVAVKDLEVFNFETLKLKAMENPNPQILKLRLVGVDDKVKNIEYEGSTISASCAAVLGGEARYSVPCWKALFSPSDCAVRGPLRFVPVDDLCRPSDSSGISDEVCRANECERSKQEVAVVQRGGCSFSLMADRAAALGYASLVVVNRVPGLFTIGSSDSTFSASLPVFSVGSDFLSLARDGIEAKSALFTATCPASSSPSSSKSVSEEGLARGWLGHNEVLAVVDWVVAGLAACLLAMLMAAGLRAITDSFSSSSIESSADDAKGSKIERQLLLVLGVALLAVVFFASRLATLRPSAAQMRETTPLSPSLLLSYNHRETDEQIYEALLDGVMKRWDDYTLQGKDILSRLHLPAENYDFAVFIHPPAFIYLTAGLLRLWPTLPLPLVPVLYQLVAFLCLPWLVREVVWGTSLERHYMTVSLKAMLLVAVCPTTLFCSQKFWLDNSLLMNMSLSVAVHMACCRWTVTRSLQNISFAALPMALSGLVFGGLALNTKITALAALPFFLLWIIRRFGKIFSWQSIGSILIFLLSATAGHAPWLWLYHRYTGRWLPSAWPSEEMIQTFPFLAQAVSRPWHHYLLLLFTLHPIYMVAVGVSSMLLYLAAVDLLSLLMKTGFRRVSAGHPSIPSRNDLFLSLATFSTYPFAFLCALTVLGAAGAGFQARFLLPALPGWAVLASVFLTLIEDSGQVTERSSLATLWTSISSMLLIWAAMHAFYYGVLAAPLYADVEKHLLQILRDMLSSSLPVVESRESAQVLRQYMRHFGVMS